MKGKNYFVVMHGYWFYHAKVMRPGLSASGTVQESVSGSGEKDDGLAYGECVIQPGWPWERQLQSG